MTPVFRTIVFIVAISATWLMLRQINKSKLQIQYSLFWLVMAFGMVILVLFPSLLTKASSLVGVYSETNLLFAVVLFILLMKVFFMTIEMSQLETKISQLVQQIALDNYERNKQEAQKEKTQSSSASVKEENNA